MSTFCQQEQIVSQPSSHCHPKNRPQQQHNPLKVPNKRVTMIKHVVGKVRTPLYTLPSEPFVFGIANTVDEEGAGDVVQSWAQTEPSKHKMSIKSFPATNRKALQNGCLSAKEQREFGKNNPVMKSFHPSSASKKQTKDEPTEHVFGIKSLANDVPMKQLLSCPNADSEETDYPDRSNRQKKGRLPPAKSTKASRLLEVTINPALGGEKAAALREKERLDGFKMKRFLNVESKVKAMIETI